MNRFISELGERVLAGGEVTYDEALRLTYADGSENLILMGYAGKIRDRFRGNHVELCSIISAKTGGCSENCTFCSQSSHYETKIKVHPLLTQEDIVTKAKEMERAGAHRFDIVTSGLGVHHDDPEFQKIVRALGRIKQETRLEICACLGTLTPEAVKALVEVGVSRYNHNLQTSRSFFRNIITSHSYEQRLETIKVVKAAGMEACCGGIFGMGESWEQRVEFAFELKELGIESIPMNFLDAIPGTPMENQLPLTPMEILKTIAIFRFILPDRILRYAGGREKNLGEYQVLGLLAGIDAMLVGNYLTTLGQLPDKDLEIIRQAGLYK
ncbi:biotin synthase BioB [Desulfitobacterium sp. Sab5]|uniref:biotin synthase BioB n=1 Tax=Desulfitobacterium nosdiversum TaxID=3375356 RepID=UPI003CF276A5